MKMNVKLFLLISILSLQYLSTSAQTSGSISVYNSGAYVARFSISFNLNGNQVTYNSGDFPAAQSRTLEIPYGGCCGRLHVENLVFIGTWRTVLSFDFNTPYFNCFTIWGTTLSPAWGQGC